MCRGNADGQVIKKNQSKDNKDSKHTRPPSTNPAATRSKTKVAAMNQENVNSPLSKSVGQTNQLTFSVASPLKSTNNASLVTPDIRYTSMADDNVSVSGSFKLTDMYDTERNPDLKASGLTTPPTCSNSKDASVPFSTSGNGNEASNKDVSMGVAV